MLKGRYWLLIPVLVVLIAASYWEWSNGHAPRENSYAAAPQTAVPVIPSPPEPPAEKPNNEQPRAEPGNAPQKGTDPFASETFWVFWGFVATAIIAVYSAREYNASRLSEERQLRAYVFGFGLDTTLPVLNSIGQFAGYQASITWKNMGQTPARQVRTNICVWFTPFADNREPDYSLGIPGPRDSVSDMGPTAEKTSTILIPIHLLDLLWTRQTEIYIGARIEYSDVFRPTERRHHEVCYRLDLNENPQVLPAPNRAPYVESRVYGPKNTSN
jgi:hypothetical protein